MVRDPGAAVTHPMTPGSGGGDCSGIGGGAVVIAPGDQPPCDEFGLDYSALPVDRGDVVVISCPPADAEVVELTAGAVIVRWPWPDPEVEDEDAGLLAVFTDRNKRAPTLWRFDPDPAERQLAVGDRIQVSIPERVGNVNYTEAHFQPAPSSIEQIVAGSFSGEGYDVVFMGVLPYGVSECRATVAHHDLRIRVDLYGPEPVTVRLLQRPYAWLVDGDQVLDPGAIRWSFYKPLWWVKQGTSEPGAPLAAPQWPLHLIERHGAAPTAGAGGLEQGGLVAVVLRRVDERDLLGRHSAGDELVLQLVLSELRRSTVGNCLASELVPG